MNSNYELVEFLKRNGAIKTKKVERAFLAIDRSNFVPFRYINEAYENYPLPLCEGQTISQPETVAFMLECLGVNKGEKILEIGAGSGWVTALLSNLVGRKGFVYSYEINKNVGNFGQNNLFKMSLPPNYSYKIADAKRNWAKNKPYNKIIAAAAFESVGDELVGLLAPGGILLVPTKDCSLLRIKKYNNGKIERKVFPGFIFVPLV